MDHPRVLVVKYNALGDVLNITPALRYLANALPGATIDVFVGRWAEPAIRHNPHVRRVIIVENEWFSRFPIRHGMELFRLFRTLKLERYDAVIAFQRSHALKEFVRLLGIPARAMFASRHPREDELVLDESRHVIENNILLARKLLRTLGCAEESLQAVEAASGLNMEWEVTPEEAAEAAGLPSLAAVNPQETLIACFPGGGSNPMNDEASVRQWGVEKFDVLLHRLSELEGVQVLLMGGHADREIGGRLSRGRTTKIINMTGEVPVRISAAVLRRCDLVICNDSGPMHIAGAVGVPVVAVFGPTGPREKLPPSSHSFAIRSNISCSPCYYSVYKGCPYPQRECLARIDVDSVLQLVQRALGQPNTAPAYSLDASTIVTV
jgi:lipopolysaccharide heptosyltransferase II